MSTVVRIIVGALGVECLCFIVPYIRQAIGNHREGSTGLAIGSWVMAAVCVYSGPGCLYCAITGFGL